ncbi:GIY-YIG nuclease family protein [Epilithonimonas sp. JDS]|uniref:GIY-YIG nuclease family protein n=1 Tax=Epilithonimonas sp. JDS TaxID=2902797 RepID=UPI001E3E8EEE|nr:GIY-YIG nuclease family protein [Epilithonimonas sp. JDS]MCD9853242.1 GIY-YIG nuclease family protein [Epilithonimonas sp. JDS]
MWFSFYLWKNLLFIFYIQKNLIKLTRVFTSNLLDRIKSHNYLSKSGYTIKFRPWKVIHVEFFTNKNDAMTREKFLNSGQGRLFLKLLPR